jgi:hypothetical protein
MPSNTRTTRHINVPTQLDWEKFWHEKERHSPERLDRMLRTRMHTEGVEEGWRRRTGLEQQASEQRIKEKAAMDAATFEKRYTAKQKLEIARIKGAKQSVMNSPNWNDKEKQAAIRALELQELGIEPSDLPKTTPWPKGEGVGEPHPKYGGIVTRDPDGSQRILFRPDQMPAWQENEMKIKTQQEQGKIAAEKRKLVAELMIKGVATGEIDKATLTEKVKKFSIDEARKFVEDLYGEGKQKPGWAQQAEEAGMRVSEKDYELPETIGYAKTFVENVKGEYGSFAKMPPELQDKYRQALDAIREYQRQRE